MEVLVTIVEKTLEKVLYAAGVLLGHAFSAAGEKVSAKMPEGRPMDRVQTRKRIKGDAKELYALYKQLERHRSNAPERVSAFSWDCVIQAIDPTPEELESPIIQAAHQLCLNILAFERYFPLPESTLTGNSPLGKSGTRAS